jgi:hypothetical protein
MNELWSIRYRYDQQRGTFRVAVCEERAGTAAGAGAKATSQGRHHLPGTPREGQRGDVKRAEARASEIPVSLCLPAPTRKITTDNSGED